MGAALASCATPLVVPGPTVGTTVINPAFVDQVIATLQTSCSIGTAFYPTAQSIANVVAALFGAAASPACS